MLLEDLGFAGNVVDEIALSGGVARASERSIEEVATLFLAINYYTNSKYTSKFVYYAFLGLLLIRPILIVLYSLIAILIEAVRRQSDVSKPWKQAKKRHQHD